MPNIDDSIPAPSGASLRDIICLIRSSRYLHERPSSAPHSPEVPMIAWILHGYGASIPTIAQVFDVSMTSAAKWISDGNRGEYDDLQALAAFWDVLVDQADEETRTAAQRYVDAMAEAADAYFREYPAKSGCRS